MSIINSKVFINVSTY